MVKIGIIAFGGVILVFSSVLALGYRERGVSWPKAIMGLLAGMAMIVWAILLYGWY